MSRQQIAERIHQLLWREIGFDIEIGRLLDDARYARDVLLVCDAIPGGELIPLAALFRAASRAPSATTRAEPPGHARQPTEWSGDTSGFGVSQPPTVPDVHGVEPPAGNPAGERRRNWLPRWRDSR